MQSFFENSNRVALYMAVRGLWKDEVRNMWRKCLRGCPLLKRPCAVEV